MRSAFAQVSQPSKASREPCRRLGNSEPEAREPAVESTHTTQHVSHNQASARAPTCLGARQSGPCLMQARRVVKKARRLVSRGLPKRLQGPCDDAFAPRRAMNIAHAILVEVCRARMLVRQLEREARLIPDGFELPYAKKEVESCLCVMDRMQLRSERAYKVARLACFAAPGMGVRRY